MSDMRRREFIIILLVATAAWPLASHAQPSEKIWRIGFLAHRYESFYDALFAGLRELGYVKGKISSSSAGMQRAARSDLRSLPPRWFD